MIWIPDKTGRFSRRPHYLPEELDGECEQLISSFLTCRHGKVELPVKTDDLTVFLEEKADLDSYADLSAEEGEVEGLTEFVRGKRPVVRIANRLNQGYLENRLRTTITHEYGHVHYHGSLFEAPTSGSLFSDRVEASGIKCNRDNMLSASESDWMEWQAGYVCGALLMPFSHLVQTVQKFRASNGLPHANIAVSSNEGRALVGAVSIAFQVSKDAARVRLLKRGLLLDDGGRTTHSLF